MSSTVILLSIIVVLGFVEWQIARLTTIYRKAFGNSKPKELEQLLHKYALDVNKSNKDLEQLKQFTSKHYSLFQSAIQYFSIVHYNPHISNSGGNQSFSLCTLDNDFNGYILTVIFTNNNCNTFCKEIKRGKSNQGLSIEEQAVLDKTLSKKKYL